MSAKKKEMAESASSASGPALFKEDMPRKIKVGSYEFGKCETSEDNSLMGRLAIRMASKDYIDKQNLGSGARQQREGKAIMQDEGVPTKIGIAGPAIEMEHKKTLETIKKKGLNIKEATKKIAGDHLKEDPKYYEKLKKMEAK